MANRLVVISGCSGGGKSTLLRALALRGYATVEEPGRRIVIEEQRGEGRALPWVDMRAFAERAVAMAREDMGRMAGQQGTIFFDRGLIDAASALGSVGGGTLDEIIGTERYHPQVFLTPPWPEIYVEDSERQHGLEAGIAEYERLLMDYRQLGYDIHIVPKGPVEERADYVIEMLGP
ncbi:AAA family ATPase [Pelagibacterium sp. H642]|uniref:AAA family ATPase n=1 Tax=Pelagibacterium sp. H642 TaxID=1881069 RepID=UPI0028155BF8|nr:AAA family ATPase [Pelagibacterium sp. H642]WMT89218.1 AAA family ATPase [Pelagibacterium sp. H642]